GVLVSYIGLPLFLLLLVGYKVVKKTKVVSLKECNFDQDE
ncbi:amino acid permease, partial [Brevibacillus fluminis]